VFAQADRPLYAVGGVVRNALMDLPASDVDLCGPALPETVAAMCEGTPVTAVLRAAHFGTVELHAADETGPPHGRIHHLPRGQLPYGAPARSRALREHPGGGRAAAGFSVNALYRPLPPDPSVAVSVLDPTAALRTSGKAFCIP
jgi:hypothetical protein